MKSLSAATLPSSTRTRCPNCGRELLEGASFCVACSDTMQMAVVKERTFLYLLLPIGAFLLWLFSLRSVQIRAMNDLGLVSVLPVSNLIALALLVISFVLVLRRPRISVPLLLLHIGLLIFMLYGVTALVENVTRFATLYRHAGYTEFIMRTGTVDPTLDTYFSWPSFFIFGAFLTTIAGYHDILGYTTWVPVFFNLLYLGPLCMIFNTATRNKQLVWAGLLFFYLTNWIGQDYYSPQGFNFFLYLMILAILLTWFQSQPQQKSTRSNERIARLSPFTRKLYDWCTISDALNRKSSRPQRVALLTIVIALFALDVSSHPLTPFFMLVSVTLLVIFRRCKPFWLPILMAVMISAWLVFMAGSFLSGHASMVTSSFGIFGSLFASNVSSRVEGSVGHIFIAKFRLVMTALLILLALLGVIRRFRAGHHDLTYALLALAPFPLFLVQDYGGEMLLRVYLFALPFLVFFAASLFYGDVNARKVSVARILSSRPRASRPSTTRTTLAIMLTSVALLSGFLFTRYGNERNDYISEPMLDGMHYLYHVAPANSVLIAAWEGGPWYFQDYEKYDYSELDDDQFGKDAANGNVQHIVQFIQHEERQNAYVVFNNSQKATFDSTTGYPRGRLDRLEHNMLASGNFVMIYQNADIQILKFVDTQGGQP